MRITKRRYCKTCKREIEPTQGRKRCRLCSKLRADALTKSYRDEAMKEWEKMSYEEQIRFKKMVRDEVSKGIS